MIDALRYEWTRIVTIRSTYWLTGLALAFAVLVGVGVSWIMSDELAATGGLEFGDVDEVGAWLGTQFARNGAPYFVGYLLAMLGILTWGHEYRHGMIRATLTSLRSRTAVFVAKYVVVLVWVAVTVAVCFLLSAAGGWLFLRDDGIDVWAGETFEALGRTVVYAVLLTCVAMAFTALVRNQTAALVFLFIWPLAIENIIRLVFFIVPGLREHLELTRFLPFGAGARLNDDGFFDRGTETFGDPLTWLGGMVIFGAVAAVVVAAALALFHRRDA